MMTNEDIIERAKYWFGASYPLIAMKAMRESHQTGEDVNEIIQRVYKDDMWERVEQIMELHR